MIYEAIKITSDQLKASLQQHLDTLPLSKPLTIEQFLNPFENDALSPINYPAVVVNLAPQQSPEASFEVFVKMDAEVPIVIEYRTRQVDSAAARTSVSHAIRGIVHSLNDLLVGQVLLNNVRMIEVKNVIFDFVKFDGDYTGGVILFTAMMRDITP